MQQDKISTYLGFCIRSGKIVYGTDKLEKEKKKAVDLLIADTALSDNGKNIMEKLKNQFGCPLVYTKAEELGKLLNKPKVKAIGIKEKNLAMAIMNEIASNGQFKISSGGRN